MYTTSASIDTQSQDRNNTNCINNQYDSVNNNNNISATTNPDPQYQNPYAFVPSYNSAPATHTDFSQRRPYYSNPESVPTHTHPLPQHQYSLPPLTQGYHLATPHISRSIDWSRRHYHSYTPTSYYHPPYSDSVASKPEIIQPLTSQSATHRSSPVESIAHIHFHSATRGRSDIARLPPCSTNYSHAYEESHSFNHHRQYHDRALNRLPVGFGIGNRPHESTDSQERPYDMVQFNEAAEQDTVQSNGRGSSYLQPLDYTVSNPATSLLASRNIPDCSTAQIQPSEGSNNSPNNRSNQSTDSAGAGKAVSLIEYRHIPVSSTAPTTPSRRPCDTPKKNTGADHISCSATLNPTFNNNRDVDVGLKRSKRLRIPSSSNETVSTLSSSSSLSSSPSSTTSEKSGTVLLKTQKRNTRPNDGNLSSKDVIISNTRSSRRSISAVAENCTSPTLSNMDILKRERNRDSCMKYRHKRARERDQLREEISGLRETVKRLKEIDKRGQVENRERLEKEEEYKKRWVVWEPSDYF